MDSEDQASSKHKLYYKKAAGTSGAGGQFYEIKLLTLVLLSLTRRKQAGEEVKIKKFYLASNIAAGRKFDDVVCSYQYTDTNGENKSKIIFVQAKHRENEERKISIDALLSKEQKGDFILRKYLSSFLKIKQQLSQSADHPIFRAKLEDCEFIIYTNAYFDPQNSKGNANESILEPEHILNVTDKQHNSIKYYQILDTEQVSGALKTSLDYQLLTNLVAQSVQSGNLNISRGSITEEYLYCLSEIVFNKTTDKANNKSAIRETFFDEEHKEFRDGVLEELQKNEQFSGLSYEEVKDKIMKVQITLPRTFGKISQNDLKLPLPQKFIDIENINQFLQKLKLVSNQLHERDLKRILKGNIEMMYITQEYDTEQIYQNVKGKVEEWWKDGCYYLTEDNRFFQDAAKVFYSFDEMQPTELFTGREQELKDLHERIQRSSLCSNVVHVKSRMTIISGLGGIGKTELARQYIKDYGDYYKNNIICINAENENSLKNSFLRLAESKLNIKIKTEDKEPRDMKSILQDIYHFFSDTVSLFVFDNVDDKKELEYFLPFGLNPSDSNIPFILITSRETVWEDIEILNLNVLNETDAIKLVKKGLKIVGSIKNTEISKFVKILQYFPLALRQAMAYIKDENHRGNYTFTNYLQEFEDNSKKLLNSSIFQSIIGNDYSKTTFTTWKITINKISDKEHGDLALRILNTIAFTASESINRDMFLELDGVSEEQLKVSIYLLYKYSLINAEEKQSVLSIHRLVQEVTRLDVIERCVELEVIERCFHLLSNFCRRDNFFFHLDINKTMQCMSHLERLHYHAKKYFSDNKNMTLKKIRSLLSEIYLAYGYDRFERNVLMLLLLELESKRIQKIRNFSLDADMITSICSYNVLLEYQYLHPDGELKTSISMFEISESYWKLTTDLLEQELLIVPVELMNNMRTGRFDSMLFHKSLISFINTKYQLSQKRNTNFQSDFLEDFDFIFFTNTDFDYEDSKGLVLKVNIEQDSVLNIIASGENRYYYKLNETEEIINSLKVNIDYKKLTIYVASVILNKKFPTISDPYDNNIFSKYSGLRKLFERINDDEYRIKQNFFDEQYEEFKIGVVELIQEDEEYSGLSDEQMKERILNIRVPNPYILIDVMEKELRRVPYQFADELENNLELPLPPKFHSNNDIKLFLSKFKLCTNQPNGMELMKIIKHKISLYYEKDEFDANKIFSSTINDIRELWFNQESHLTEMDKFFSKYI